MSSPIIFALDFPNVEEATAAAKEVAPALGMVKVGLELFVGSGPKVVSIGKEVGLPVFLDLKLHDIPETVERAVAQASDLGARLITVHASGGRKMLERAVARAKSSGGHLDVVAVTILTSLDDSDLDDVGITVTRRLRAYDPNDKKNTAPPADVEEAFEGGRSHTSYAAANLARLAFDAGVRWFVCSPAEVALLRKTVGPEAKLITPGVRPPASADKGDQKRVATPKEAMKDGADWLVVGRPIRDASDRLSAASAIAEEALSARAPT
jgi:orotidine-5'-phosphate decarboxylase